MTAQDEEKVVALWTVPNEMIATVEDLLRRIKNGEIESLVICAVGNDDMVHRAVIGESYTLLGVVAQAQRAVSDKIEQG